jgi:transposase
VETIRKIQRGFADDAMGITQIEEWYSRFKDGRTLVESEARSGRPSTRRNDELIDQGWTVVMQGRRVTIRELAEEVGISIGSVHSILTDDLAMRRVPAKFVPKLLTMEQKQLRLEVSQNMPDVQKRHLSCDSGAPLVGSARSDSTRVVKVNRRKKNRRKTRPYCTTISNP